MGIIELFLIAVGLSMDAFAVAICKGLNMRKLNYKDATIIGLFFGVFQGGMPLIGWFIGSKFEKYITAMDHWITFFLLLLIGLNMIKDAIKDNEVDACPTVEKSLYLKELFLLAIATSIDALAVGITFAFLKVQIVNTVLLIGITTCVLSFFGVIIGNKFGCKYKKIASIAGGVVLIIIGANILLEHLQLFSFL